MLCIYHSCMIFSSLTLLLFEALAHYAYQVKDHIIKLISRPMVVNAENYILHWDRNCLKTMKLLFLLKWTKTLLHSTHYSQLISLSDLLSVPCVALLCPCEIIFDHLLIHRLQFTSCSYSIFQPKLEYPHLCYFSLASFM